MKKIMLAVLTVSVITLNAPVAQADTPKYDCGFHSAQQADLTGQSYEGVAYGYAAHAEGGSVSIRCYVTVNGVEVSSTPTGSGYAFGATSGRVTFTAAATDNVELCAEVITSHGTISVCGETTHTQIPPQAVIDLLTWIVDAGNTLLRPTVCLVLRTAHGTYGPIRIEFSDGDLYIRDVRWYNCPPY